MTLGGKKTGMLLQARLGLLVVVAATGAGCGFSQTDSSCDAGAGCSSSAPHAAPCAAGEFHYVDQMCGLVPDGGVGCSDTGDGLCYAKCRSSADCSSGYDCVTLGLYNGGDYNCNATVKVCATFQSTCP